ncbi:hypothetical protein Tco_0413286 [Tanacetum coccineum]
MDGKVENFDSEGSLSGQGQSNSTRTYWLGNMKGKDGIYTIGFTGEGLFGASVDAERVAVDITMQWSSYREHLCLMSNRNMKDKQFPSSYGCFDEVILLDPVWPIKNLFNRKINSPDVNFYKTNSLFTGYC